MKMNIMFIHYLTPMILHKCSIINHQLLVESNDQTPINP
jgi:hypothetical protein